MMIGSEQRRYRVALRGLVKLPITTYKWPSMMEIENSERSECTCLITLQRPLKLNYLGAKDIEEISLQLHRLLLLLFLRVSTFANYRHEKYSRQTVNHCSANISTPHLVHHPPVQYSAINSTVSTKDHPSSQQRSIITTHKFEAILRL